MPLLRLDSSLLYKISAINQSGILKQQLVHQMVMVIRGTRAGTGMTPSKAGNLREALGSYVV